MFYAVVASPWQIGFVPETPENIGNSFRFHHGFDAVPAPNLMQFEAHAAPTLGKEIDMRYGKVLRALAASAALVCAMPANADVLDFTGHLSARAVVGADPSCAPLFKGVISPSDTVGNSSLGAFTYGHTACTSGAAGGPVFGAFTLAFLEGDGFEGTFDGLAAPTATPPLSTLNFIYTILGGTGRFAGATGTFTGIGTADPRVRPSQIELDFNGAITAPAVPEPATWAMLILGFGMVGWTMRYRSARLASA